MNKYNKIIEFLQDSQFEDPTFFSAIRLEKPVEEQILFTIKQLKIEKDQAYKMIDKLKGNTNER